MGQLLKTAVLLILCYSLIEASCPEPYHIHCKTSDRCIRLQYICDGDSDCEDRSDEDPELCRAWKNNDCERYSVRCTRRDRSDCITIPHYCEMHDPPCQGSLDRRICQILRDEKLQNISAVQVEPITEPPSVHSSDTDALIDEFKEKMDSSVRHTDCPMLFTKVGHQCVSVFYFGSMNWMESRAFCQSIGGDLLPLNRNLTNFYEVLEHFRENHMTGDFWLGGIHKNETEGWKWVDNTDIQLGSPIWAVRHTSECATRQLTSTLHNITLLANDGKCYRYKQAPSSSASNMCTVMNYEHYHYVSDENCLTKKSPLCYYDEYPRQAL